MQSQLPPSHPARDPAWKTALRPLYLRARGQWLRGSRRHCPLCQGSFRRFLAKGDPPRPEAMCPRCLSLERHRLLWLYLTRELRLGQSPADLLHFAPEPSLRTRLAALPALRYTTLDIRPGAADLAADLEALPFPSGCFDILLCSHVLEHVARDERALRELFRVLRPGGLALLQVPLRAGPTLEDPTVTDPGERRRRFGQEDHVRLYGDDFAARVEAAGFQVRREDYLAALDPAEAERCHLSSGEDEPLFLARKDKA